MRKIDFKSVSGKTHLIEFTYKVSYFNKRTFPHLLFSSGRLVVAVFTLVKLLALSFAIYRRSSFLSFSSSLTLDFRLSISSFCSRIILSCFQIQAFRVSTSESTLVSASKVDCNELILSLSSQREQFNH